MRYKSGFPRIAKADLFSETLGAAMVGSNSPGILCLVEDREHDQPRGRDMGRNPSLQTFEGWTVGLVGGFTVYHFSSNGRSNNFLLVAVNSRISPVSDRRVKCDVYADWRTNRF